MILPDKSSILDTTTSLCPICMHSVAAQVIEHHVAVYLHKECPEHGLQLVNLWPDVNHYRWINNFRLPAVPATHSRAVALGCPLDCGLCANHLRHPTLVEIEVTQRCNLRCPVCFMSASESPRDPTLLELESMFLAVRQQAGVHISLQLTGGEPTVRSDLAKIVSLGQIVGFQAIEINTNGIVIAQNPAYLAELAQAGISGIYLQFDGMSDEVYRQVRGAALLETKLKAIENCRAAGIQVVLAMTVLHGINHDQIGTVLDFALENLDVVAGLALQPAFTSGRFDIPVEHRISMGDVVFMLAAQSQGVINPYDLWPLGCSHPLCSCATLLVVENGNVTPVTRLLTPDQYREQFNPHSPQGSVFSDIMSRSHPDGKTGLSVLIMNYMDADTIDLQRLRECSMTVTMLDGRQIPFCAYQISSRDGLRLHPAWGIVQEYNHDRP